MSHYIRNGGNFRVVSDLAMEVHKSLPVGTYTVMFDQIMGYFLSINDDFKAPKKLYGSTEKNAARIIATFHDRTNSTGVLLVGEKGSGKTLLAKIIAREGSKSDLPTLIINQPYKGDAFNEFIKNINQPCIIIFDEFEKVYDKDDQNMILTLLDGHSSTKNLFVFTCNESYKINDYMLNRPGRIYYYIEFKGLDVEFIEEYCNDNLNNKKNIHSICQISTLFHVFNFDMLQALVEEMNRYDESAQEALKLLNAKIAMNAYASEFKVELYIDGVHKTGDSVDEYIDANPLTRTVSVDYEYNESKDEWLSVNLKPEDLIKIDAKEGTYVYHRDNVKLILRKKKDMGFDPMKTISTFI